MLDDETISAQDLDAYQRALPFLKFVRGNSWQAQHWAVLFEMLQMPSRVRVGCPPPARYILPCVLAPLQGEHRVTVDSLTLGDLLSRAERIVSHCEAIKALDAQAQGEGVIRKVLDEVEGWAVARGLATQPYTLTGTSTRYFFWVAGHA